MEKFNIGEILRSHRLAQKITQEQLCEGICDPSTISRIENGRYIPSKDMLILLLQRLGVVGTRYYGLASFDELELEELKLEIKNANSHGDYKTALELLDKLEKQFPSPNEVTKQFVIWSRAINGSIKDGRAVPFAYEDKMKMLLDAIHITVPRLDLEDISSSLLGLDEIMIIADIANAYFHLEDRLEAIEIYRQLLKYTQNHLMDISEACMIIPLITYNYSFALGYEHRYKEELKVVQIGIDCCVQYSKSVLLGELLINKACALYELGEQNEAKRCALRSFYILDTLGQTKKADSVRKYIVDNFNCCPE